MKYNNSLKQILTPIIIVLILVVGIYIGNSTSNNTVQKVFKINLNDHDKLSSVINLIDQKYVDSVEIEGFIEDAIAKLLEQLDPHSTYIPARELKTVNEEINGSFSGIGIQFSIMQDTVNIVQIIPTGPSEKMGLMPGDKIIKVDDSIFVGEKITNFYVMKKLKGLKGTSVKLGISRRSSSEILNFEIIRGDIPLHSVDIHYMIKKDLGYLKISSFGNNTYREFIRAVVELKKQNCKKLIIDLRGNPGGLLQSVVKIADAILPSQKLIVFTEGKAEPRRNFYATSEGIGQDMDIAILIDDWSASASEILAGAVQDNDRGIIIGRRSFGKGLVQQQIPLNDGSALRLTVSRYYTPTGRSIQKSYQDKSKNYYQDILDRYNHGEFISKDSINFIDTLKYTTPGGRVIYGGGGIMPDIFVPIDTTYVSPLYRNMQNKGILYQFSYDYANEHRNIFNKYKIYSDFKNKLNEKELIQDLIHFSEKRGVKIIHSQLNKSRQLIITYLKAYIARNIIGDMGFYPILKDIDTPILKAIEEMSN